MSSAPKRTIRVIGAGPTALAVAARAAKLGHSVHLLDPEPGAIGPGGSLRPERRSLAAADLAPGDLAAADLTPGDLAPDDFVWDGPEATFLLPAALRDLFRKSGRPLEAVLDLEPVITEHQFADGSSLRLPGGSRAGQLRAVAELSPDPVSGAELGRAWCDFVAGAAEEWEVLRRNVFERGYDPTTADPRARGLLATRTSLAERVLTLPDPRLRSLATVEARLLGHRPEAAPHWLALVPYVEQRLGRWRPVGGGAALLEALTRRLAERRVEVFAGRPAPDPIGEPDSDSPDLTIDTTGHAHPTVRDERWLSRFRSRVTGAPPPGPHPTPRQRVLRLAITDRGTLPRRLVVHADDPLELTLGPQAPPGYLALSVVTWSLREPLEVLAECGVDLEARVLWRQESTGMLGAEETWQSPPTDPARLGVRTDRPDLWRASPALVPGLGLPGAWLAAAQVAEALATDARGPGPAGISGR